MSDERRREEQNDLAAVMGSESGRRVLRRILDRTELNRSVAARDIGVDAQYAVWYASGQADVGRWIMEELAKATWDGLELMRKEAHERSVRDEDGKKAKAKEKTDEVDAQS